MSGADVDLQDKDDQTPLHYAAQSISQDALVMLLDHSASIHLRDKQGQKVLLKEKRSRLQMDTGELTMTWKPEDVEFPSCRTFFIAHSQLPCINGQHYSDGIRAVCFSAMPPPSALDQVKLGIESFIRAPIGWWPLSQPRILASLVRWLAKCLAWPSLVHETSRLHYHVRVQ
jgi:hypothetical protein